MSAINWAKQTFADSIVLNPTTTPGSAPATGVQVYAKADGKLYTLSAATGTETSVGSGGSVVQVTQASHGFVAADVGRPLYLNSSTYTLAKADLEATAEVAGLISKIIDSNIFEVCLSGEISAIGANVVDGGGSLVAGEVYFLSAASAGKITTTPPSVVGQISKPLGIARTIAALDFFNMRGSAIGGSNVYTQISLTNNTTTTIQNTVAYDSVELAGWMYINATAKYRFHFKAQVTKKGDATDYLISYQTSGDTPPVGFNISVTTSGLVQVTLPSVSGFTSAIAQFSLNGPAVGASLPLSIDSSNVSFGTVQAKDSNGIIVNNSSGVQLTKFTDRVREHIYHYSSATNLTNQYIHLKTNIAMTDRMPLFKFAGYAYGEQKPIDTNLVLYAYSVSNSIINVGTYGSHTCSTYKSTDGYVVLTILLPNMYFVGFSVSVYQLTPSPVQTDITISAATNSSSSTGVY
jgi:hypothetical protein